MKRETLREVPKVWGREIWLVNNKNYCGKLLIVDEGAQSSYHYHKKKKETFYVIEGFIDLKINNQKFLLGNHGQAMTIEPNDKHSFFGVTRAIILEVSTHHNEDDSYRITESRRLDNVAT